MNDDGTVTVPLSWSERHEQVKAERDRLRADNDEYDQLLTRLRDLLTGTANALKGTPPELVTHDWSDLPKVAGAVVTERDRLRAVVERFQEANAATLAACTSDQSTAALEEYRAAVDALLELDGSGVMGGPGPAGGAPTREGGGRLDEESGAVDLQAADAPGEMFPAPPADAIAERDRLRAVVEAAHGVLTGLDWSTGGGKKLVPVTALHALRDALDGTGITGGDHADG